NGKPEGPPVEIDVERLVHAVESICKPAREAKRPREAQKPRKGSDGIERELLRRAVASAEEACNGGGADGIRGRNDAGFWLACQLRDHRIPIDAAAAFMYEYVEAVSGLRSEPYTPEEADLSLEQAYSEEPREPWGTPKESD